MNCYRVFMRVYPLFALYLFLPFCATAQTVLFQESMGVPAANTPVVDYLGFDNYDSLGIQFSSGSTTDVRSSSASDTAYYASSSGEGNIFINDTNEDFVITGIPIDGFTALSLSFGLWKGSIAEDGSSLTVEVIVDGGTPLTVPISLPTGSGTAVWHYQTPVVNFPTGSLLSLRFNGESSSAFRIDDILLTGIASPTPVVLRSFNAVTQGTQVRLDWETTQEINSAYYDVQRSDDARSYKSVGRIPSRNNPQGSRYAFTDSAPVRDRYYYRLQMVDFDGKTLHSRVRMVNSSLEQESFRLLENPVSHSLRLRVRDNFSYTDYAFYDLAGGAMFVPVRQDGELLTADVSGLQPGVYLISVENQNARHTLRFLKR